MRNDLNGLAAVNALSLIRNDIPVNPAGSQVGILRKGFIDKSFVVAEIQIRFSAVVRYKHFAVLNGIHRARIHIQIRIQFLRGNFQPARF